MSRSGTASLLATLGATGERGPRVWAFSITGIIAGGVIGAVATFGVIMQFVTGNFAILSLSIFIGWALGMAAGGAIGLLAASLGGADAIRR